MGMKKRIKEKSFYNGSQRPIATTVLALKAWLDELPEDLLLYPDGAELTVFNIASDKPFLSIDEIQ